jgi:hypothetical protein
MNQAETGMLSWDVLRRAKKRDAPTEHLTRKNQRALGSFLMREYRRGASSLYSPV